MLTPRRMEIFKAIVDEYIRTAEPVGSSALRKKYRLPYSSATIRNEMQELEEMGFLEKPIHLPDGFQARRDISSMLKTCWRTMRWITR